MKAPRYLLAVNGGSSSLKFALYQREHQLVCRMRGKVERIGLIPLPRRFEDKGVRRYGFHGLSYAFLLEELKSITGPKTSGGRIIMCHLGNDASLAAIRGGKIIVPMRRGFLIFANRSSKKKRSIRSKAISVTESVPKALWRSAHSVFNEQELADFQPAWKFVRQEPASLET